MKGIAVRLVTAAVIIMLVLSLTPAQMHASAAAFSCATVKEIPLDECDALVALYNSAGGAGWTNHATNNWLVTNTPSNWVGVTVANGHVTQLKLSANNLVGSITPWLGGFTGSLPKKGGLQSLEYLWLNGNKLTGSVPRELGYLSNLVELKLNNNQLSGIIPPQLAGLPGTQTPTSEANYLLKLKVLDLSNNQFTGVIPSELGMLTNLMVLHLNNNQLGGEVPSTLVKLTKIPNEPTPATAYLTLDNNQLTVPNPYPSVPPTALENYLIAKNSAWNLTQGVTVTIPANTAATIKTQDGGISVVFDAGDLGNEGGSFKLTELSQPTATNGTFVFAKTSFHLVALDASGKPLSTFTFAHPVTVKISYNDADLNGMDEDALTLFYYDTTATTWKDVAETCTPTSTYTQDYTKGEISVDICHLSEFALMSTYTVSLPQIGRR